jgi:hypothetical protein
MGVEELAEKRAPGALDLGDEDERLANLHEVPQPSAAEPAVLSARIEALP